MERLENGKLTYYWKGWEIQYTGETEDRIGVRCHWAIVLSGPYTGERCLLSYGPVKGAVQ